MDFKVFVGIDISKLSLDIALLFSKDQTVVHRKIENNSEGFKQILTLIKNKITSTDDILFCMEHTGVYGMPIAQFLSDNKLNFSVQSPLQVKRSMGIIRGKSDKADAAMLAKYASLYKDEIKLSGMPTKVLLELRNVLAYRDRLMKAKVSLENASGELVPFTKKEVHHFVLQDSKKYMAQLKGSMAEIDKEIKRIIRSAPEMNKVYDLATSVPGIGLLTASYLIVHTNCFTLFDDSRKLACYCGVAPFEHTSGTSIKGKTRVSNIGNKKLKSMLGLGALAAIVSDGELSDYYNRRIQEGKNKSSVLNSRPSKSRF